MAGYSRIIDEQKEQKPKTIAKGKMEPPIQILMDPNGAALPEVAPVQAVKEPPATPAAAVPPLKIIMEGLD